MPLKKGQRHSGQFKPGHVSTGGRKKLPAEIRSALHDSYDKLVGDVVRIRGYTLAEAERRFKAPDITLGERVILNSYLTCDERLIKNYEDRAYGKPIESHRFVGKEGEDRDIMTLLGGQSAEEIIKIGRMLAGVE